MVTMAKYVFASCFITTIFLFMAHCSDDSNSNAPITGTTTSLTTNISSSNTNETTNTIADSSITTNETTNSQTDSQTSTEVISYLKVVDDSGSTGNGNRIFSFEDSLLIIYSMIENYTDKHVKVISSADDGETWSAETLIDLGEGEGVDAVRMDTSIYVAYTNDGLKFMKSADEGKTWDTNSIKTVDANVDAGYYPSIAVEGSLVAIAYYDLQNKDLKFAKSADDGETWSETDLAVLDEFGDIGSSSDVWIIDSTIYIAYADRTNAALKFIHSVPGDIPWLPENISIIDSGMFPVMNYANDVFYLTFSGDNGLEIIKSYNQGESWPETGKQIIDDRGVPDLLTANHDVYVVYSYLEGESPNTTYTLNFSKSTDSGITWSELSIKTIASTEGTVSSPSIEVNGTTLYVSFFNDATGDLMFTKSLDSGDTWN